MEDKITSFTSDADILAKIRRLKIQESVLLQNLKCFPRVSQTDDADISIENHRNISDLKKISIKINDSLINIKNLFDEIKAATYSQEILKSIEIDDIKKKILELDANILSLKAYLGIELASLKSAEQELTNQINENLNVIDKMKKQPKLRPISYNKIIPSPVKMMMNSPLKCQEVQQFHEFMSNSQNRYGSWNEYNHNIFAKYWKKYFQTEYTADLEQNLTNSQSSEVIDLFLEDLLCKLQGVEKEDVLQHINWYLKYIHLKERQQKALNNWKSNKRDITGTKRNVKNHNKNIKYKFVDVDLLRGKNISDQNHLEQIFQGRNCEIIFDSKKNELSSKSSTRPVQDCPQFSKPTKQWISRCDSNRQYVDNTYNIKKIKKLRTPGWRLCLQEYT